MTRLCHPWSERNKAPILEVLRRVLPASGTVLEVGSGSGQHAAHFAGHLAPLKWLASDLDSANLDSIRTWTAEAGLDNLLEPVHLDVRDQDWGVGPIDAVFSANMIHIAPWPCCLGLLAGARRHLADHGLLILYGPFRIGGRHTAESNAAFDRELRQRHPKFGVRDVEAVCEAAEGFELEDRIEMPANNQVLVLRKVT